MGLTEEHVRTLTELKLSAQLTLLDVTFLVLSEAQLRRFSVRNYLHSAAAASLLGSKILLTTPLSIPLSPRFLLHVRYVSFQYKTIGKNYSVVYPLETPLNPICHLLALLGAHHILHVSGIRVIQNTMIYTHKFIINCSKYTQY